jgi:hypothetical protein
MASEIYHGNQSHQVSNGRFGSLMEFGLQVADETARSEEERRWVERFRVFKERAFAGIGLDLNEQFPEVNEKQFWARVYFDVARRIFLRQIGNQKITYWQSSAIGDAYVIARMLCRVLQDAGEKPWPLDTEDEREENVFLAGNPWNDVPDSVKNEALARLRELRGHARPKRPRPGSDEDTDSSRSGPG